MPLTFNWDRHMSTAMSQASHMACWWVEGRGGCDTGEQSHDRKMRSARRKFLKRIEHILFVIADVDGVLLRYLQKMTYHVFVTYEKAI